MFCTLWSQETVCLDIRRDNNYWSSVSQPPLDVWGWLDVLLIALKSPLWSTPCHFYQKQLLKFKQNNTFWQLLSMGNRMPCYMEIHPLLLECFITLPSCIMMTVRSFDSNWELFMLKIMSFLPKTALNFWAKYQILGTLSTWEMGCRDIRSYIHCFLNMSESFPYIQS